ncbi:MAG: response regulator [Bdellovibrionota bacterium]|jgi:CheY-like chemotaxis protein
MKVKILLVDDDCAHRLVASRAVKKLPHPVEIIESGSADTAINLINEAFKNAAPDDQPFNLAIIDLKLDHKSGIDVLNELRSFSSEMVLPVIIVSTSDLADHINSSYAARANCYIIKGADPLSYSKNLYQAVSYFSR